MKRTCLISSALALTVLAPTVASAEPAILYVPTEPVTLGALASAATDDDPNEPEEPAP